MSRFLYVPIFNLAKMQPAKLKKGFSTKNCDSKEISLNRIYKISAKLKTYYRKSIHVNYIYVGFVHRFFQGISRIPRLF